MHGDSEMCTVTPEPYREPVWVRVIVVAAVGVFGYGTVVHLVQLVAGWGDLYPGLPGWLGAYFVSLTVLDPLAAVLLAGRRRAGLVLGCAVLVSNVAANGYAAYVLDPAAGVSVERVGHAVVVSLTVTLLVAAPRLWPHLRP